MERDPAPAAPVSPAMFLEEAEARLLDLTVQAQRADWVHATYITPDTEAIASEANARLLSATTEFAQRSATFNRGSLSPVETRKFRLLRLGLALVAPSNPRDSEELARRASAMASAYATGRYTPRGETEALDLEALSRRLEKSRDPAVLEDLWTGWHAVGRGIRPDFERCVELANRGARELGYSDLGAMWRSKYDLLPEEFEREAARLWEQVRPLYRSLHAYVRHRLREQYGPERVPESGPIPAHLLGNMWAQSWEAIYSLVRPEAAPPLYDLTERLTARRTTPVELVRYGERFFVSLGLDPLPASFWERSMLVRPPGRDVVCHASAWDVDYVDDLRIKMCIEITGEDFNTVHHELGHNYYQRAYSRQPFLFRDGAHDGFHEAVGDTVALSVTPDYLVRVGLLDRAPGPEGDIAFLLHRALERVAFLPFGYAIDVWRWRVFSGNVPPAEYNTAWWKIRRELQGIAPPSERGAEEFDPGAKYHVPSNTPYMRYFLAFILQFQFHRALTDAAGITGPLHLRSIYGSAEAGRRLGSMLTMGSSRPWPDALEAVTGERRMDAAGLLEYFAPLQRWLDEQNRGIPVGW